MKRIGQLAVTLLLCANYPAFAQDWDWEITPYLWAAGIDGGVDVGAQSAEISVEFPDILDVLAGVALIRVEAHKGDHRIFGDLVFMALEEDDAKDTLGGTLGLEIDSLILEAGYSRKVSDTFAWDFGFRYWDMESKLIPEILPSVRTSSDWTDGFVGPRFTTRIADHWTWITRLNVGAGGSDLALGLDLDFRRKFDNDNSLALGFRALSVDFEDLSETVPMAVDLSFTGITIGYVFD